ncbi:MAG TPA: phosphoribosylformylglycinamidine cyclo-ligase, partial [Phycisphaerae bacterium]|nr:phosphoribosylformylglycinamidine cyclo-ligase [Phycisphaerae bacterium]
MAKETPKPMTYKQAGVDIDAGEQMVKDIGPLVARTHGPRVMDCLGGFAGLFRLDYNEKLFKRNYTEPVLVGCTDGVGTKVKVAIAMDKLDTVGIDLVAMSVNDLICCGAEPLFFLDYIGTGRLSPARMTQLVKGVSDGCLQAGCALLGGETAEMPDVYSGGDFDLAGFAVGVVERKKIIDSSNIEVGDHVIALASDGLHSNGYGLARRVLFDKAGYSPDDAPPELLGASVGQAMLTPTRIYVKSVMHALAAYKTKKVVKAMAHITGGGLPGNLPRVLPEGFTARIKLDEVPIPPIFDLIAKKGPVDQLEMQRTFNMGVGFVMVVASSSSKA